MNATTAENIVKTANDNFDTTRIVTTVNRLINETPGAIGIAEVIELNVQGHAANEPARLFVTGKVLYRENNCVVSIPMEVDAGAFKGLEAENATH